MIEIEHLNKTYPSPGGDIHALRDVNLRIEDGEIFGIIGLSGAGKSTLVRCINLLERPTSGTVRIDGRDMTQLSRRDLLKARQDIGMIFQSFNLLKQRTVLRNICFPLEIAGVKRDEAQARAAELLELVGLSDRAKNYPSQLSGGQKQRVAIARALATRPKYLLCDEATSALDPNTTQSILHLLKEINQTLGVTIVVITHEMRVIEQICQRVAVIDQSCIAEIGNVSDVFTHPKSDIAKALILPKSPAENLPPAVHGQAPAPRLRRQLLQRTGHLAHHARVPRAGEHSLRRHPHRRGQHLRPHGHRPARRPAAVPRCAALARP